MSAALHVVILAAGEGKRMRSSLPKVLQRIAGKPMLAHVIAASRALSPAGIHVVYGHGGAQVRAAFADDLPPEVLQLPKRGFSLPLDRWFRGELVWLDLLAERQTRERPHLRPGGIARVVDLHRRGRADLGHGLYLLVAVELYLRCIDRGFPDLVRTEALPRA